MAELTGPTGTDLLVTDVELGAGSHCEVRLARHVESGVEYAVKVMEKSRILSAKLLEVVFQEKELLSTLDHPNIVRLYSTYQDGDHLYYVLQLANSGDLWERIPRPVGGRPARTCIGLSLRTAQYVTAEVVSALQYLHTHNIVHRDLKPENILLNRVDGLGIHVLLVDFGTALRTEEAPAPLATLTSHPEDDMEELDADAHRRVLERAQARRRSTKQFVGTAQYASPELLIDCTSTFSSDLWSLGACIFQMLSGTPPFLAEHDLETFRRILERDVGYPRNFPDVGRDLVDKLLVLNPCDRLGVHCPSDLTQHPMFNSIDFTTLSTTDLKLEWPDMSVVPPPVEDVTSTEFPGFGDSETH